METSNVTAVILAGGIGSRFKPFATNKTLFPFLNKPVIQHTLEMVAHSGLKNIVIATSDDNHEWLETYARESLSGITVTLKKQAEALGMADALLALEDVLPESNIVIMNAGDLVGEHLLPEFLSQLGDQYAVITGMVTPTYQPLGYLVLDGERVTGVMEKPGADNMPSDVANLMFHYFSQPGEFISKLKELQVGADSDDIYEQALTELMQANDFGVYRYTGPWQKLKYGHHVLSMTEFFLKEIKAFQHESAQVHESATVEGEVYLDANARVHAGATIIGPAYIGPNVIIGNGSLVRQSIVEADAVVGYGSEIARSYVGPKSDLHHAYVGDSVLENAVHFGYGSHTANLRFDQKNVPVKFPDGTVIDSERNKLGALMASKSELGVNSSLLPGVTIGAESVVYPGSIVHQSIGDRQILKWKQEQSVVERA